MKIRKATKKDLEGVYGLFLQLIDSEEGFAENAEEFLERMRKKRDDFSESSRKEILKNISGKNSVVFVAESGSKIIGYISGNIFYVHDPFFNPVKLGYLNHIVVSEEYTGTGIARQLYSALENYFREKECTVSSLEVFSTNPAVNVFKKMGFKISSYKMRKELR